jgi:signal transduction histidine kinase
MGDDKNRQVAIGYNKIEGYYEFFVEDTGIGIRKEYQNNVFKIFSRLKQVEAEGSGVGLIIVKKIVEMHKGKIWIESPIAKGKGSRFCFTIPESGESN